MDVSPDKQNIGTVFSGTRYDLYFYQRDYKWNEKPVENLLDDILYKFNETDEYDDSAYIEPDEHTVDTKYPWYYLNTYVTNTVDGRVYLVDGQQRLTTLLIILIKLLHMSHGYGSELEGWIDAFTGMKHLDPILIRLNYT